MEVIQGDSNVGAKEEQSTNNGDTKMGEEISDSEWLKMDYECLSDQCDSDDSDSGPEPIIQWIKDIPQKKIIPFTGSPGLSVPIPKDVKECFKLLFDDKLFATIAKQTNKNADEIRLRGKGSERKSLSAWTELTEKEVQQFIGLALVLGNVQLEEWWDMDEDMIPRAVSEAKRVMKKERFYSILRALSFADPTVTQNKTDPLFRIRFLLEYFSQKMQSVYYPSRELIIDEPAAFRRGMLQFPQGRRDYKHKCAMRLYSMGESNGLVMKYLMTPRYDGEDMSDLEFNKKIVNHLLEGYKNKGHSVYTDSLYNSVSLFQQLLKENTYCTGYLLPNRKGIPQDLKRMKLKKGDCEHLFTEDGVCVVKWRPVMAGSSEHDATLVPTMAGKKQINEPKIMVEFERNMGDIEDRHDLYRLFTGCYEGKPIKWHIRTGLHVIYTLVVNACVLYNKYTGKKMSQYRFKFWVAQYLLGLTFFPNGEEEEKEEVSDEEDFEESSTDDFFDSNDESDTDEEM